MQDEQDVEMLGSHFTKKGDTGTPSGIEITNWDVRGFENYGGAGADMNTLSQPSDSSHSTRDNKIVPFPRDPTAGFHNYTYLPLLATPQQILSKLMLSISTG